MKHFGMLASIAAASLLLNAAALADTDKKTDRLWKAKCSSCHGASGQADTTPGKAMKIVDMSTAAFQAKKDDELKNAILNGVKKEKGGVKQEMTPFKDELTPEQVDSLIALIRSFKK